MPDYAIITVPQGLVEAVPDRELRELLRGNIGDNFASRYHPSMALWNAQTRGVSSDARETLKDVLAFDAIVINGDRKTEKPNLLTNGDGFLLIDHSLALPVFTQTVPEDFPFPEQQIRSHCTFQTLCGKGCGFSQFANAWSATISDEELALVKSWVPESWEQEAGDIGRIFTFLRARPNGFGVVSESLRSIVK